MKKNRLKSQPTPKMPFHDHFSNHASNYVKYRPHYPTNLFEYLASLTHEHKRVWDCGTGNGQAALGLTPYFGHVIATDPSEKQITNAVKHENIKYYVTSAEQPGFKSRTVDLITAAQAVHWFDFDVFYGEVKRILKPGGILAFWCYDLLYISPKIDKILYQYYTNIVGPFWPPERRLVEGKYQSIPLPFDELEAPKFQMKALWNLSELLGYLDTWSATQRFIRKHGFHPIRRIEERLTKVWGSPKVRKHIQWPLYLRIAQMH